MVDGDTVARSLSTLADYISDETHSPTFMECDNFERVYKALHSFPDNNKVQLYGCLLMERIAITETNCTAIISSGGVEHVMACMDTKCWRILVVCLKFLLKIARHVPSGIRKRETVAIALSVKQEQPALSSLCNTLLSML